MSWSSTSCFATAALSYSSANSRRAACVCCRSFCQMPTALFGLAQKLLGHGTIRLGRQGPDPTLIKTLTERDHFGVHSSRVTRRSRLQSSMPWRKDSMKTRNAAYFVSPRTSSIRDLACLIASARLTGVTPAFFFPSPNLTSHRQPIPSSN
jgi:hypothetical protein